MANTYLDKNKKLWNEYKVWIMRHELRMPAETCSKYSDLINFLHNYDFFPPDVKDKSRGEDGLEMRSCFLDYGINNGDDVLFHKNPKVLEVLAALACRMDNEYVGDPSNPKPYIIFLDIIENNLDMNSHKNDVFLDHILSEWIEGNRPLFKTKGKPTNKDIWSQMQMYIHEKNCS